MVIDCFSKYVFTALLKRKNTDAIITAFKEILSNTTQRPERLASDKGGEFNSLKFKQFMKANDIIYNHTNNEDTKCGIVERCIRTLKSKISKYLTYKNTYKYIDVLPDIVKSYNNTYHRTIKMAPSEVNEKNILQVYRNMKESWHIPAKKKYPKIKVGDYVRMSKSKTVFEKGYLKNWTEEIFKVQTVIRGNPILYRLVDLADEEIEGTFYEAEIQKIIFDKNAIRAIETIIKQRRQGKNIQYFVKWRGYPSKFNSWIDSKSVTAI